MYNRRNHEGLMFCRKKQKVKSGIKDSNNKNYKRRYTEAACCKTVPFCQMQNFIN